MPTALLDLLLGKHNPDSDITYESVPFPEVIARQTGACKQRRLRNAEHLCQDRMKYSLRT